MKIYKYLPSLKKCYYKENNYIPNSHNVICINTMKIYKYLPSLKNVITKKIITSLVHTMLFT